MRAQFSCAIHFCFKPSQPLVKAFNEFKSFTARIITKEHLNHFISNKPKLNKMQLRCLPLIIYTTVFHCVLSVASLRFSIFSVLQQTRCPFVYRFRSKYTELASHELMLAGKNLKKAPPYKTLKSKIRLPLIK